MNDININRALWNNKTDVHYKSEFYDNESFIDGRNSLNAIEISKGRYQIKTFEKKLPIVFSLCTKKDDKYIDM